MKEALIKDILIEKFKETKRGSDFGVIERHRLLHMVAYLLSLPGNEVSVKIETLQTVLEHCFSFTAKMEDDAKDLAPSLNKIVSKAARDDVEKCLLSFMKGTQKLQLSQHVNLLMNFIKTEKSVDKINEFASDTIQEQVMSSLVAQNFIATVNSSIILSLSAFFVLRAKKLNDLKILGGVPSSLLGNDAVGNYLAGSKGFVNSRGFVESKEVSVQDVENQMLIIEYLIKYHFEVAPLKAGQFTCLLNTLCESLLNRESTFRA